MSVIKVASVICEFNPFHNGHKFLIEKIKENYADIIVCIMSGNFVQRGDISITDKFTKSRYALENGADLVIELPTVYANSNATIFAKNGVEIAKAINSNFLCFGTNDTSQDELIDIINLINSENSKQKIKENLASGYSYPKALDKAISSLYKGKEKILRDSNNILAIEYLKSLKQTNIKPIGINRIGVSHDSDITNNKYASASKIRQLIFDNEDYSKFTPIKVINKANISNIEKAILIKLKSISKKEIDELADNTEGIGNRLQEGIKQFNTLKEIIQYTKTKRYTEAKIRRLIISAFLGITSQMQNIPCPYVRILGMNKKGSSLLKNCSLPLITNLSSDYDKLNDFEKSILDIDINTSNIISLATDDNENPINEFSNKIIKY